MFLYINPIEMKRRCKRVLYPEKVTVGNRYYYSLDLPIIKGVPQWQGLVTDEKILIPTELTPPQNFAVYGDYKWQVSLAAEKLKKLLKKEKCDLIFYDEAGCFGRTLMQLIECARNVSVVTQNVKYYQELREDIYGALGCYVEINTCLALKSGYEFIVNGNPECNPGSSFRRITVNFISEQDIVVPKGLIEYFPNNLSKCALSEAIYSGWGMGRIGEYVKNTL